MKNLNHCPQGALGWKAGRSPTPRHSGEGRHTTRFVFAAWLLLAAGMGIMPKLSHAEISASAAAALKVLSVPLPHENGQPEVKATPSPSADTSHASITVLKGESIDAVIRRALPGLPLREDFLRQALAKLNPDVFPKGKTYPVRPGTVLRMPTHDELRHMLLSYSPDAAAFFHKPTSETLPSVSDKRHWVRYP